MSLFEGTTSGEFMQDDIENVTLPETSELPLTPESTDQE
jgi:hypothetical protein